MSDPAATDRTPGPPGGGAPAPLTPAAVDAVLADFRAWLLEGLGVRGEGSDSSGTPVLTPYPSPLTPTVDLFTLVGQFTALRHEVNLQTKAARAAVEQNAEVLKLLAARDAEPAADDAEDLRPVVKAVLDIADALALSLRQMEKLRESAEPLLDDLADPNPAVHTAGSPGPGFFARLFGTRPAPPAPPNGSKPAADKLRQLADAAIDGYAMSLRRVERVLPTLELEPIPCTGEPYDPELMEVVEVVADSGEAAGTVVEEVRTGYRWRGKVFRFAQVKVAR